MIATRVYQLLMTCIWRRLTCPVSGAPHRAGGVLANERLSKTKNERRGRDRGRGRTRNGLVNGKGQDSTRDKRVSDPHCTALHCQRRGWRCTHVVCSAIHCLVIKDGLLVAAFRTFVILGGSYKFQMENEPLTLMWYRRQIGPSNVCTPTQNGTWN